MKEIQKIYYQCEGCFTEYGSEEDAKRCEAMHVPIQRISRIEYRQAEKLPVFITVRMEDGRELIFNRY